MKRFALPHIIAGLIATVMMTSMSASAQISANSCSVEGDIIREKAEGHSDRITVELAGKKDGPDIILIPGLSTPRVVWDDTVRQLAGCYRLHLVQVRGFGDAPGANAQGPILEPLTLTIADYIDDAIYDAGRGKPKIIGHSFGGLTAMKLGLAVPNKVSGVMVVDSLPFFGVFFGPGTTAETIEPQAKSMRSAMQAAKEPGLDARTLRTMAKTKSGQAKVSGWVKQSNNIVNGQVFYEVMTTDIREELKSNKVPVTMLYPIDPQGAFPADMMENVYKDSYAPAANVTLRRIDDSAHFIMLDQPEKFYQAVQKFLANK